MKVGDIVICIDIEYAPFYVLKVDKRYEISEVDYDRSRIKLKNVINNWWIIERFVTVKEYRKLKLKKIYELSLHK